MVGKKSGRALLREEGLQRTDNNMDLTSWPQVGMINQKNYYTEFLKRDDQVLALRLQQEERLDRRKKAAVDLDRARAQNGQEGPFPDADPDLDEDDSMEDVDGENYGSKTIIIHVGSQNLRLGFATDALPKTVPMVIARRADHTEAEDSEPVPKRIKLDEDAPSETWFGEDFAKEYETMAANFKQLRRQNKRRVLPNSRELVTKWNSVTQPELISEHNDPLRIDWTELPPKAADAPNYVVGEAALRIPEKSRPKYRLKWPVRHGWLNEKDYPSRTTLLRDFFLIIEESIKTQLDVPNKKDWNQYSCVFLIPDLYEKTLVATVLQELIRDFGFSRVCFMQESLAATFGAGFSTACIVDMGAQKTTVCCIEDGMCFEESRINLKYGGYDVTETFVKMMLYDRFNYDDINLMRRHDFLLAEELKERFTTLQDDNISVQLYDFHLRAHGQETRKYQFKLYDEGFLAPQGYFKPEIFSNEEKLAGRRKLIGRSLDLYDGSPNDPMSAAQKAVYNHVQKSIPSAVLDAPAKPASLLATPLAAATPSKHRPLAIPSHLNGENEATPRSSVAGSPPPDDAGTPAPNGEGANGSEDADQIAGVYDLSERIIPIMSLHDAIITSIEHASNGDERKRRDFLGSIMLTGGASKTPNLQSHLELQLRAAMPQYPKEILVAPPPRDLDPSVIAWKGGSVFGKLRMTNDSWISGLEYDRLGSRILNYKCMWHW
ncbi:actin-related protein, ARP8 class [Zymoseptoria tritici IPO323]|uniref:Actin-related protein, ARP8 class n=1 Tax=Zymoseptoria tritici (strain CBS 115943 / IPO323) TaxID=336722 RepID=F9X487_ZYMTI|nr:actin-related protein, ARP8 class [Zymoseptoria tritici IPO323]EGP89779.1 actin-related protein, ARP8 class [Zymoseptoria tritici IPO323]